MRLKNFRLELIDGSWLKHLMLMRKPKVSHPKESTSVSSMSFNFTPCNGLLGCSWLINSSVVLRGRGEGELVATIDAAYCQWQLLASRCEDRVPRNGIFECHDCNGENCSGTGPQGCVVEFGWS